MENTPKFNIHQPPDPQTGQCNQVWVELDPGDGCNFQSHPVARVTFDSVAGNWKVERQSYTTVTTKPDKDAAIKEAIKMLTMDWAAQ